jgi:hypothetical protein
MREKHVAIGLAVLIFAWVFLTLSGLDVEWLGVDLDAAVLEAR